MRWGTALSWVLACAVAWTCCGCGEPAQLGPSEEAFHLTDALWTAVSGKRPDLVAELKAELAELHEQRQLPDDAHAELAATIAQAEAGEWDDAREALRAFMRGQRRAE